MKNETIIINLIKLTYIGGTVPKGTVGKIVKPPKEIEHYHLNQVHCVLFPYFIPFFTLHEHVRELTGEERFHYNTGYHLGRIHAEDSSPEMYKKEDKHVFAQGYLVGYWEKQQEIKFKEDFTATFSPLQNK